LVDAAPAKIYRNKWEEVPDYGIQFQPSKRRLQIKFAGEVIVDTDKTLILMEPGHQPVCYIPRADARMEFLARTDHHSHCSWKGHCSYYTINAGGKVSENAIWSYEEPYPQVKVFKGYLAFYSDRVDSIFEIIHGA
jgi:uncharacterized protein (DUF427 family)